MKKRTLLLSTFIVAILFSFNNLSAQGKLTADVTTNPATTNSSSDGSVTITPSGGVGPYTIKRVLHKDGVNQMINTQNYTASSAMNVDISGDNLKLKVVSSGGWNTKFLSNQTYASSIGLTFRGSIFVTYNAYKAFALGFHDQLENGISSAVHSIYFFDNGSTAPISLTAREYDSAEYFPTSSYSNNISPGKWVDFKVRIGDGVINYFVKPSDDDLYTNSVTRTIENNVTPLKFGVRGTSTVHSGEESTHHKNWVLYDAQIAQTTNLTAGTYDFIVEDSAGNDILITKEVTVINKPTLTTTAANTIVQFSATLGGNVTADGGASITERGVVYAITTTNADPLIDGTGVIKDTNETGTGSFSESIGGLTPNTQYSFKAYATNSQGTSYGTVQTFITTSLVAPTIMLNNINKVYGDANFDLAATSNSGGIFSYTIEGLNTTGTSLSGTNNKTINLGNVGSITIRVTQAADGIYSSGTKDITLTIGKATLTVTADDKSKGYGDANPAFTISYSGFKGLKTQKLQRF